MCKVELSVKDAVSESISLSEIEDFAPLCHEMERGWG